MTGTNGSASSGRINLGAKEPCLSVAATARLRAAEQARLAHAADGAGETATHREQQDYLLALAHEYEALASRSRPATEPSPARSAVTALTIPGDPFR